MGNLFELTALFIVLTDFMLLASSRIASCIRTVALQGFALGLLLAASNLEGPGYHELLLMAASVGLKGIAFPVMLTHTLARLNVKREVEPYLGYPASIMMGIGALVFSFWVGSKLPAIAVSGFAVPVAFSTMLTGFLLIISRRKALTQVIGYLTAENGIFMFGVLAARAQSLWVDLAVMLDVLVAVFVMGIAIHNINAEFESTDVDRFDSLTD